MREWKNIGSLVLRASSLALMLVAVTGLPAEAHHMMGGRTPSTFMEGLLSGLGHPVIGLDHLAFIVAMGVAVGVAGLNLAIPALFIVASAIGVALHVRGVTLPGAELLVALSVLVAGAMIALGRSMQALALGLGAVRRGRAVSRLRLRRIDLWRRGLAACGLSRGASVIVQAAVATGVALIARRSGAAAVEPRLAGAAIAGIGIAILAGQFLPA